MKITVNEVVPVPQPVPTVSIEFTQAEMRTLVDVFGNMTFDIESMLGVSKTYQIFDDLDNAYHQAYGPCDL